MQLPADFFTGVCTNGHPYTPQTTIARYDKTRQYWAHQCQICTRLAQVTYKYKALPPGTSRRSNTPRTFCRKGHRLDEDNVFVTILNGHVSRQCIACQREKALIKDAIKTPGRRTHCKRGHPMVPGNIAYHMHDGREVRMCKTCMRERYLKKKGE